MADGPRRHRDLAEAVDEALEKQMTARDDELLERCGQTHFEAQAQLVPLRAQLRGAEAELGAIARHIPNADGDAGELGDDRSPRSALHAP